MSKKKQYMHTHLAKLLDRVTDPYELYDLGTEIGLNIDLDDRYKLTFVCFEQTANRTFQRGDMI